MKANFKNLNVELEFDKFQELDITKDLGNYIHANTPDIGMDDVARDIYRSEGEVEIPEQYAQDIVIMVKSNRCPFVVAVKKAIIAQLTPQSGEAHAHEDLAHP